MSNSWHLIEALDFDKHWEQKLPRAIGMGLCNVLHTESYEKTVASDLNSRCIDGFGSRRGISNWDESLQIKVDALDGVPEPQFF